MKLKVTNLFYDKFDITKCYEPGTVVEFDDERAESIIAKGLAIEEKPKEVKPKKQAAKKVEDDE